MIDIQNEEQRNLLKEAADTEPGKLIVQYLREQMENLDTNRIVRNDRNASEVNQEFWAKSEARDFIQEIINILN